ncbi:glycosyltransferase family 4 protein [Nitrospinota bacterium]
MHTILYCHHYTEISGGETSLLELWRNLDRSRFRPVLAGPKSGPFADAAREAGVEVRPVDYGRIRQVGTLAKSIRRLRSIARKEGAAILHASGPTTNIPAALAARLSGLPVIWHARNLIVPGEFDLDRFLSPLASLIIANSDAIRERFRFGGRLGSKSMTIINGVDTARFHPSASGRAVREKIGVGSGCILAGVVGRISPAKGQQTFIEAAASLAPRHPNLRFLIVGAGLFGEEKTHEDELRRMVSERDLGEQIYFSGYHRDVVPLTAALDICVIPSDAEPCGRVIFEAMAMSRPVVGTNTGGTPEIAVDGETGILIPPRDAEALVSAIERLALDEGLRRRMGEAGRCRVEEKFTIQAHARKTEAAYLRLLGGDDPNG